MAPTATLAELAAPNATLSLGTESPGDTDLASLWVTEYNRFQQSRERIAVCGKWRRNEIMPHVPADFQSPDAFRVVIPLARTMSSDVMAFGVKREPRTQRNPLGPGPMAQNTASHVEEWLDGALNSLQTNGERLWDAVYSHATNDGEFGVLVLPRPAHYGPLLNFDYDQTTDNELAPPRQIAPMFKRDRRGRSANEALLTGDAFVLDGAKSRKAYEDYVLKAKARTLPFVVRVLAAGTCLPIGVSMDGKVDALLIRTERTALSLRRNGFTYRVLSGEHDPRRVAMQPMGGNPTSGIGGIFCLYELFTPGAVQYQVGPRNGGTTFPTALNGDDRATIDLDAEYGLTSVPGGYFYGAHDPSELDPNLRGIPLLAPFISLIGGVNQVLTADVAHMFNVAFGGWFIQPDKDLALANPEAWIENGAPREVKLLPMRAQYVVGTPHPGVHPGTNKDVAGFVNMALTMLQQTAANKGMDAAPADGGFAQGVAQAALETLRWQQLGGAQRAYKRIAECLLEQASVLSELTGKPIPVYAHVNQQGGERELLELDANDLQGDFTVEVYTPTKKGSNLPLAQAGASWVKDGLIPEVEWLESMYGAEDPEDMVLKLWVERQLNSPQGQQAVLEMAAKYQGDQSLAELHKLQQAGQVTAGGLPAAMVPPRPGMGAGMGQPAPGGAGTAPGQGNPAASALAGIQAGAMQTAPQAHVIAATGAPVPVSAP